MKNHENLGAMIAKVGAMILMKNYEYRHQHEDHYNFLTPPLKIDHRSCQHHVTYKNIAKNVIFTLSANRFGDNMF